MRSPQSQQIRRVQTGDAKLDSLLGSDFGLAQLVARFPDYVTCMDRELRIALVNRTSEALDGLEYLGVDSRRFVPTELHDDYTRTLTKALDGSVETFQFDSPHSGHSYQSRIAPLRTADGEIVGLVSTTRDVSEQRETERRLESAYEMEREVSTRLREIDELKNEFVAKVAHDLRTPITTVQGFAATMLHRWDDIADADKRHFLQLIADGADRLMVLVEDILEVANIESAEFSVVVAPVDVTELIHRVEQGYLALTAPGRVAWDVPNGLPPALVDERRMVQVLNNLVSNALKFSPEESTVTVRARADEAVIRIDVADAGVGIAADDMPSLFQKFVQVGDAEAGGGGTGLGLYIARSLVEAQGGRIWLESDLGVGTTVTVELPIAGDQ